MLALDVLSKVCFSCLQRCYTVVSHHLRANYHQNLFIELFSTATIYSSLPKNKLEYEGFVRGSIRYALSLF